MPSTNLNEFNDILGWGNLTQKASTEVTNTGNASTFAKVVIDSNTGIVSQEGGTLEVNATNPTFYTNNLKFASGFYLCTFSFSVLNFTYSQNEYRISIFNTSGSILTSSPYFLIQGRLSQYMQVSSIMNLTEDNCDVYLEWRSANTTADAVFSSLNFSMIKLK